MNHPINSASSGIRFVAAAAAGHTGRRKRWSLRRLVTEAGSDRVHSWRRTEGTTGLEAQCKRTETCSVLIQPAVSFKQTALKTR